MGKVKVLSWGCIFSQVGKTMREKEKPKITPRLLLERDGAATLLSKPAGGVRDALKGLSLLTA